MVSTKKRPSHRPRRHRRHHLSSGLGTLRARPSFLPSRLRTKDFKVDSFRRSSSSSSSPLQTSGVCTDEQLGLIQPGGTCRGGGAQGACCLHFLPPFLKKVEMFPQSFSIRGQGSIASASVSAEGLLAASMPGRPLLCS